jgi:hypothetical protein
MIGPVKGRVIGAALAAAALLAGAGTAFAALTSEGSPYAVGTDPYSLDAADFNGDGRPDVATVNGTSGDVSVFLRQPGGGFAQEPGSPFAVGGGPSAGAVGDYNGDGRPDLAVASYGSSTYSVLLRQPGGGFALQGGSPVSLAGRPQAIVAGDFDGQGGLDLAVSLYDSNQVAFLFNTGNGFSPPLSYPTGTQPSSITAADFNGDGLADVALVNRLSNSVTILIRQPAGGFAAEPAVATGTLPGGIASADFNVDGRPDLAVTNYTSGTVSVLLRRATNDGFVSEGDAAVSTGPVGIAAADIDLDGRPDLAVAANGGALDVLRRNAGGGFTRDPSVPLAGTPNGVAAADFNGDARPDFAVSAYATNTFSVLLNPAPAQPPPTPSPTPTPVPSPEAGKSVNVRPVSGKVTIKRPGSKSYLTLTEAAQIPVGSAIDTRAGRITITAAQGKGRTASADFYDGLFTLTQTKGSTPVTTLTLTEKLSCPRSGRAAIAAKKNKTRKLWGEGSGSFRTRGLYSAATVRGTRWLTQDTCTSTLTRVAKGAVSVRDLVKRRTMIVRAGKRYIARRKR